jgi:hypothetical protein
MKLVRLNKMYLIETCKVCIGKHLSDDFAMQNDLKQGDGRCFIATAFELCFKICH